MINIRIYFADSCSDFQMAIANSRNSALDKDYMILEHL